VVIPRVTTPTTTVAPSTLARTGSDSADLARTAGWLMIIGGLMVALVRKNDEDQLVVVEAR
jgi:hypothetical protein